MDFETFVAPLGGEWFMADYFGEHPVHIPADGARKAVIDWGRFRELLALRSHWSEPNINLIMNSRPVGREHYMEPATAAGGGLADPNKVAAFLEMGASLVANSVERIAPEIRALTAMLSERFAASANANVYCSFGGIQAFHSHFDPHEVFALHCEGEKTWRIYRNRAETPLPSLAAGTESQQQIDRMKGEVLMEVRMRPGDLLYIPRGFFHDALASSEASLHVTLGVLPASGRILFRLLEQAALRESAFREYLPDGREAGGGALRDRIAVLADRLGDILRSPAFLEEVVSGQAKLIQRDRALGVPERPALQAFARTDRPAQVVRDDRQAVLRVAGGGEVPLGALAEEAEWMIGEPAIVDRQWIARFPHRAEPELRALVDRLVAAGLFLPYQPKV